MAHKRNHVAHYRGTVISQTITMKESDALELIQILTFGKNMQYLQFNKMHVPNFVDYKILWKLDEKMF